LDTKLERLAFLESMGKRLVAALGKGDTRPVMVGWDYATEPAAWGLPAREGGYGLVSVLVRPGRKHVTLAGDPAVVRGIERTMSGEGADQGHSSVGLFELTRKGWEPEWSAKASEGSWAPLAVCGVGA
jgi:hypothetical protein